jgi:hypothetical protein
VGQDVAFRGPGGLALYPPADPRLGSGLRTTCLLARALPWSWLKRGASASELLLKSDVPAHGSPRRVQGQEAHPMAAVMIGIDPHKASHTAVVISAAEEPLGELRVRGPAPPSRSSCCRGRRRGRSGPGR